LQFIGELMVCLLVTEVKCCQTVIGLLILMSLRCHSGIANSCWIFEY